MAACQSCVQQALLPLVAPQKASQSAASSTLSSSASSSPPLLPQPSSSSTSLTLSSSAASRRSADAFRPSPRAAAHGEAQTKPPSQDSYRWNRRNCKETPYTSHDKHTFTRDLQMTNGWNSSRQVWDQPGESGIRSSTREQGKREGGPPSLKRSKNRTKQDFSGQYYVALLKACAEQKDLTRGRRVHRELSRRGLLEKNSYLQNTLVSMYAKCGLLAKAQELFDKLAIRGVVSWNALISGYTESNRGIEAIECFRQMKLEGIPPNAVTFLCLLKACASVGDLDKGEEIHAEIAEVSSLENNVLVATALMNMYAKCGLLAKAQEVFDKLLVRDVVSWNALITGYVEHGDGDKALHYFEQMQLQGFSPNAVTFVCSLKACAIAGAIDKGQEIHAEIARKELLQNHLSVGNALVNMYAKCGVLSKAQEVFDQLPDRDVVSWTALIEGYAEHGCGDKALACFEQMQRQGLSPDAVAYLCSLKACASVGAIDVGKRIHAEVAQNGLLQTDNVIGNALVNMYAKCGSLSLAQEVFDKLPVRDVISWTALITGYANVGEAEKVFHIFYEMVGDGVKPAQLTFICVLVACSHLGLLEKGQMYFESMRKDFGITPCLDHYRCMIDLLGRAGQLDKAIELIKNVPEKPDYVLWHTLLGACRKWGNVELGREAFEHALKLDEKDPSLYVCMANIYSNANMQEDAKIIEAMRVEKQAWESRDDVDLNQPEPRSKL